jgi:hypothetical protein
LLPFEKCAREGKKKRRESATAEKVLPKDSEPQPKGLIHGCR